MAPWVLAPVALALVAVVASYLGLPAAAGFDIAWTSSALAALVGMLAARSRAHRANRTRWTLWAMAAGCWLAGQVAWDVYGVIGFPASPNLADIGWWGFAVLVMASMLRLPPGPRAIRLVAALESVPLVLAAVALCLAALWSTALHSHLAAAPETSDLLYSVLYSSAAILTLQAMLGGTLRGLRAASLRLVLLGIGAQAVGFIMWTGPLLLGTYVPGDFILDPVWVAGLSAMGVGGLLAARRPEEVLQTEEPSHSGVILPSVMFLGLFTALLSARLSGGSPPGAVTALELGLLGSGAALIARSSLLGRRMHLLLDREREALRNLHEREAELARLNEQLVEDSRLDPLTGIGNRRALSDDLPMYEALQREQANVAVALCDVDHFKSYNDHVGHLAGDQALRMIASVVRGCLRSHDAAYRFGGEELLLVLRDVGVDEALAIAERVRGAVRRAAVPHPKGEDGVLTVSVGIACGGGDFSQMLARADAALYEAKRLGRDRAIAADAAQTVAAPARPRPGESESPVPRHLRSMLAVSRAAAAGQGVRPVLEALAHAITVELSFGVVVVNLLDAAGERLDVVVVQGDRAAREMLLDTSTPLRDWQRLLRSGESIHGAAWLRAGSYEWEAGGAVWTPAAVPSLAADAWHPEDMLLLPLRSSCGELLGVVSVDQPLLGRRPTEDEIGVLMAVADHAALAVEQVQREGGVAQDGSDELRLAAVMLLAETLDLRDPGTARHSRTVGQLARMTAEALGLPEARVERIHAAGVLHDLGKLGIADAILQKPGALDEAEWREMRRHSEVGARILEHAGMHDIAGWVRWHHERLDGRGYPDALPDERIPLESRILAVADSYEAMIADRPYRAGMPHEAAREELLRCAGTQFDISVVAAFLEALEPEKLLALTGTVPQPA